MASLGARNFGTRYVIVLPMFLAVAAAAVTVLRRRWVPVAIAALVAFVAVSSLRTFPYYLPYGNEAFGGPAATARHLHDSNVDWGQDLGRLADRLRERYPGEPVWLAYKGSGVPAAYGISARDPLSVPAGPGPRPAGRLRQPGRPRRPAARRADRQQHADRPGGPRHHHLPPLAPPRAPGLPLELTCT